MRKSISIAFIASALLVGSVTAGAASSELQFSAGATQTYIVLYKTNARVGDAATAIAQAGGTLVQAYDEIGVVIARSDNEFFRSNLLLDARVEGAAATGKYGSRVSAVTIDKTKLSIPAAPSVADAWGDPLSYLQWDMTQIRVPEAHGINTGSPTVVVGDIDTGIDYTHPDLAPNVDFANSVSCVGGVPNTDPAAWFDDNFHGTHTAGTIAAAANGMGIVGVAPNARIAAIKAGNADGLFFPEAVVCAFMWAGSHRIPVVNNSYFADPWLFNCRNDAEQRAIWKAEQRAIRYAMQQGVTVVASQGNENMDLSKRNVDAISPDYPPGSAIEREVTNACVVIPVEIPGVIGVTAIGSAFQKTYYSSYGVGTVQLTAPGGDYYFQVPPPGLLNEVLSTIPTYFCGGPGTECYWFASGTSMAAPHVAGVAALILSQRGPMPPGAVQAALTGTAVPMECPPNPFMPGGYDFLAATCAGGAGYNGFFGHGRVDALNAVTNTR